MAKTLLERYTAGLKALGYVPDYATRVTKTYVYMKPGSDQRWYLGSGGSLRRGKNTQLTRPCGPATKEHVVTAPERRPAVFAACDALAMFEHWDDPDEIVRQLQARDAGMAKLPVPSLLAHVKAWKARV